LRNWNDSFQFNDTLFIHLLRFIFYEMQKKHFPLNPPNNLTIIFENKPDNDRISCFNEA